MQFELNKTYCMDCLKGLKQLPDKSVDLIVTDPPFNFDIGGYLRGAGLMTQRHYHKRINESFGASFNPKPFLKLIPRVMKRFNAFIFCNKSLVKTYLDFAVTQGYNYDILIWHKPRAIPIKNNHHISDLEYCIYIREKKAYFDNNLPLEFYKKVQTFDSPSQFGNKIPEHPTIKPLELIKGYVLLASKKGDIILDCFMGSGTTAAACKQLGRNFIGFEINPKFCKLAEKRVNQVIEEKVEKQEVLIR